MGLYDYPSDPEATSAYFKPINRIPSPVAKVKGSAMTSSPISLPSVATSNKNPIDAKGWMGVGASTAGAALGAYGMSQQKNQFSNIEPSQYDPNSAPVYTAGQAQNEVSGARAQGATGMEIGNSALQGFTAGMATGNPLVAAGAALGNAAITGIGGAVRKRKQGKEIDNRRDQVTAEQQQYNQEAEDYRLRQNQLYDYYNQNNAEGREYNVLRSRMIT